MSTAKDKLIHCFSIVFPSLPAASIPAATAENTPGWDSVALVTLVSLVEEEFNTSIPPESYEAFTSFESIANLLNQS